MVWQDWVYSVVVVCGLSVAVYACHDVISAETACYDTCYPSLHKVIVLDCYCASEDQGWVRTP